MKDTKSSNKITNNKYLFLGIAILFITIGLYFVIRSIPGKDPDIEGNNMNAVSSITSGQKITVKASDPTDTKKYAPDNKTLKQLFTNSSGFTLANGKKHTRNLYYIFKESGGNYVYCIQLGTEIGSTNPTATDSKFWRSLNSFQKEAIELIMAYGFPNKKRDGYTNDVQFLATQMLIWEVQQGWRVDYKSVDAKTKTLYNFVDGNAKLTEVYKSIIGDVNNHKKIPSFTNSAKSKAPLKTVQYVGEDNYKYSVVLTDSNKVLSNFKVSSCPTGVTCKISSNKLTITSKKEIDVGYVKLTKNIPTGTSQSKILLDSSNSQKMILGVSKGIDPIVSYLKIDNEDLGSIKIVKTSQDKIIKGFKFKVTGPNNYDKTFTTDSNGVISISNLHLGKYTITEIDSPARYSVNASKVVTLTAAKPNVSQSFYNELKTTSGVKVRKIDKDTGDYVSGVGMKLMLGTTTVESFTTAEEPYIIKQVLKYGKEYKVCETLTPSGYLVSNVCKSFTVKSAQDLKTITLTFENEKSKMSIIKLNESGNPLSGATLQILKSDKKTPVGESWVSTDKEHVVEGLTIGESYVLRELEAPEGYIKANDVTFIAKHNMKVEMKNTLSKVEILKVNEDGKGISGAVLQVYESDGKTPASDEWTSTSDKIQAIEGLKPGETYILREKVAPQGYLKADDKSFTVSSSGTTEVSMKNVQTTVSITKTDITGTNELSGAHLQVINSSGEVEQEWVSVAGKAKVITGLNFGETYTLKETVAPDKYAISEEIIFTVGKNTHVIMKNKLTEVVIYKKDKVSNLILKGAKLQLIDPEGKTIREWVSGEKPEKVEGLLVGKEYIIKEVSSPDKYLMSEDIKFTLAANEKSKEIIVYNTPIVEVPNTASNISVPSIIAGIILVLGGAGTVLWIKKKQA